MIHLYQIVYSAETRAARDPGFEELDNMRNQRPDWYEYWPIRNYLQAQPLDEGSYYGFFSPEFGKKTGIDAAEVRRFMQAYPEREVYLFSPFFDELAFHRSIFEQGEAAHPGLTRLIEECLARAGVEGPLPAFTCSKNAVYSNYMVARPAFWKRWFAITEAVFRMAEDPADPLHARLNAGTTYKTASAPYKTFVIERIASWLLSGYPFSAIKAYPVLRVRRFPDAELAILDALKFCYIESGHPAYLEIFEQLRGQVEQALRAAPPRG